MASSKRAFRVRFSLTALLIVVTAVSLWLGRTTYLTHRQKEAIRIISAAEGIVIYKEEEDGGPPNWLRTAFGPEYFEVVKAVTFATDMGRKKGTEEPKVTDEALAQLEWLVDLEELELSHNESVADAQLVYLNPLNNLKTVYLYRTQIEGPGLIHLSGLNQLEHLALGRSRLGDEGLEHISRIRGLISLRLDNTKVTDSAVARLAKLQNLETLTLNNTDITDKSLTSLQNLKRLKQLGLAGTRITPEGAQRIKLALPKCNVSYSFGLGKTVDDSPLFRPDDKPLPNDIRAEFKSRGIDGHIDLDSTNDGSQIVSLFLGSTTLSDEVVLDLIETMPYLRTLVIRQGLVGDRFLEGLKDVDGLEYVELNGTNVTNDGLQHLLPLTNLRELYLNGTAITDDGLEDFPPLWGLRQLSFENTRVTMDAIEGLRERLPDCRISN